LERAVDEHDEAAGKHQTEQDLTADMALVRQLRAMGVDDKHFDKVADAADNSIVTDKLQGRQANLAKFVRNTANAKRILNLSWVGSLAGNTLWQLAAGAGVVVDIVGLKKAREEYMAELQRTGKVAMLANELRTLARPPKRKNHLHIPDDGEFIAGENAVLMLPGHKRSVPLTYRLMAPTDMTRRGYVATVLSDEKDLRSAFVRTHAGDREIASGSVQLHRAEVSQLDEDFLRGQSVFCPSDFSVKAMRRFIELEGLQAHDLQSVFSRYWLPPSMAQNLTDPAFRVDNSPISDRANQQRAALCLALEFRKNAKYYYLEEPFELQDEMQKTFLPHQIRDFVDQYQKFVLLSDGADAAQPMTDGIITLHGRTGVGVCGEVVDVAYPSKLVSIEFWPQFQSTDELVRRWVTNTSDAKLLGVARDDYARRYPPGDRVPDGYPADTLQNVIVGGPFGLERRPQRYELTKGQAKLFADLGFELTPGTEHAIRLNNAGSVLVERTGEDIPRDPLVLHALTSSAYSTQRSAFDGGPGLADG
jgi:hypothetical protein